MESTKKRVITKKSVGIILFSKDYKNVLLVQKRNTYSFVDFITGKYVKSNKRYIQKLFNGMTIHEKTIIMSTNFEFIWYYAFISYIKNDFYYKCQSKFIAFINENGRLLRNYLLNSSHAESTLWEAPKGRKNPDESNITCAMREMEEETAYLPDEYNFIFDISNNKYKNIYMENNIRYNIIYYMAKKIDTEINNPNLNKLLQMNELANIKWVPVNTLHKYNMTQELKNFILNASKRLTHKNRHYGIFDE